jgi:hypothetical protein
VEKYNRAREAADDIMAHAHCILDTHGYKHTFSEYVRLTAFPPQQWLRERASVLSYTYIACLVNTLNINYILCHSSVIVTAICYTVLY